KALVARRLLRRNRNRHGGEARAARAARAGTDGKSARTLCQRAEPPALAIVDLDPSDPAVGIGIELDVDIVGGRGRRALRHFDQTGGAANAERGGRRVDLHVAGFRYRCGDEGDGALADVEDAGVLAAAFLVDEIVDGDLGIGGETKRGAVVEGDA